MNVFLAKAKTYLEIVEEKGNCWRFNIFIEGFSGIFSYYLFIASLVRIFLITERDANF
jgi:hypothetical protein